MPCQFKRLSHFIYECKYPSYSVRSAAIESYAMRWRSTCSDKSMGCTMYQQKFDVQIIRSVVIELPTQWENKRDNIERNQTKRREQGFIYRLFCMWVQIDNDGNCAMIRVGAAGKNGA